MRKRTASPDTNNSAKRRKFEMAEAELAVVVTDEEKAWFKDFKLYDDMDEEIDIKSVDTIRKLGVERQYFVGTQGVLATDTFKKIELTDSDIFFGVMGMDDDEHMVIRRGDAMIEVKMECAIMMEPLPPFKIIQYQFEDGVWRVSKIGAAACENYRKGKFKHWEEMIKKPVCEASLRRMVEIGLITTLFDHLAFPNPPEMQDQYEAINDETGKKVLIPHPVQALRVWDSTKREYTEQNARLEGTPNTEKENEYWQEVLKELRTNFPEEMERIEKGEKKAL